MTEDIKKGELVEQILQISEKALREVLHLLSREWLQLDLTMPQLKVVSIISSNGPLCMSVIAADLGVSLAAVTGVVDRLVERGIVLRQGQPGDRRVVLCALSEKGQELIDGLWRSYQGQQRNMLKALDFRQLQAHYIALEVVLQTELAEKEAMQQHEKGGLPREVEVNP